MHARSVLVGGMLLSGIATTASAQICAGTPSFASGMIQTEGGVSFGDGGKVYSGGIALGRGNGFFVSGEVGRIEYNDGSAPSTIFGGALGYGISLRAHSQICPVVAYAREVDPDYSLDDGTTVHTHQDDAGLGLGIGTSIPVASMLDIIPFGSASYAHNIYSARAAGYGPEHASQNYGTFSTGFGVAFNKRFTIRPSVSVPFGVSGSKASYDVDISVNFGPRGH